MLNQQEAALETVDWTMHVDAVKNQCQIRATRLRKC
jgi:hypothetical protein